MCSYPAASGELGPATGDQLLQQALQEETAKAASKGLLANPFAGVQFKEVILLGTAAHVLRISMCSVNSVPAR